MHLTSLATPRTQAAQPLRARKRLCDDLMEASLRRALLGVEQEELRLGRYVVGELIGRGAMGTLYRAYDPVLRRNVAVKLLRSDRCLDADSVQRLVDEAGALARLQHPNVVSAYELRRRDDDVYIVMEWVHGLDLAAWCADEEGSEGNRQRLRTLFDILGQAARGLEAVHEAGIVHRDIKPENILVGNDGRTRIADFGLSQQDGAAHSKLVVGTPRYMAPEQSAGHRATERSDVFSFCVTAWEALCGKHPWAAGIPQTGVAPIRSARLRAWPLLRATLEQGMQQDPARRLPRMRDLAVAFAAAFPPESPR